jgi:hypothetical protein
MQQLLRVWLVSVRRAAKRQFLASRRSSVRHFFDSTAARGRTGRTTRNVLPGAKSRRNAKTDGYDGDSGADRELSDSTPIIVIGRKGFFLTVKM